MDHSPIDHRKLFSHMPVPRLIVMPAEEGIYHAVEINKPALEYFGRTKDQVIGRNIKDFMDDENALQFEQTFEVCAARKKIVTIQALPGVPGNMRVYSFLISPLLSDAGELEYLDVLGQPDIADQSVLQRERDDAISLLTSVFDVSEIGIVVTDGNSRIVRVNDAFVRAYGWQREELISAEISSLVTPDEREAAKNNHAEFIRTGVRTSGEMKLIRKDSGIANALFTTATLELSHRRRFQVTTVMDITLRKQMEISMRIAKDQADTANRAKSAFLANMSHELRTPLNAIIGFSDMMVKETFGPLGHAKYAEYLEDISNSGKHLLEIINEVLDMSKIEAGRIELDESEVDVRNLIESVTRMMASRAFGNNISIHTQIEDRLPNLVADQRLLRQVFINLVTNALKFSHAGGRVDVTAALAENGDLVCKVIDHGVGIPKDKIKQALEPFGQVSERPENSSQQGTGLGLPLAKAMVDLHEGSLELNSDVGQGTTVIVRLPAERVIHKRPKPSLPDDQPGLAQLAD